jgi:hypothetical protein
LNVAALPTLNAADAVVLRVEINSGVMVRSVIARSAVGSSRYHDL